MIREVIPQFNADETHTSQTVTLDDVTVRLDTYTVRPRDGWALDLYDSDGVPLVQGIALVTGLDLLFPYRHLDVPPGPLFVGYHEQPVADPAEPDFLERRASLYYQEVGS